MQRTPSQLTNQSGGILVQICMFVTVITSIAALSAWMVFQIQNNRTQSRIDQMKQRAGELETRSKRLLQYDANLKEMLGLEANADLTPETVEQLQNEALEQQEGLPNVQGPSRDIVHQLEAQIRRLARHDRDLRFQNTELQQKLSYQETRLEGYQSVYESRKERLNTYSTSLDTNLEEINQNIQSVQQDGSDQVSSLEDEIASEKESHEKELSGLDEELSRLQNNIGQLKTVSEAQYIDLDEVDGKVIRTDPASNWVYINIGSDDRVKAGYQFGFYASSGADDRKLIGKIQVKQVFQDYARCSVVSQARVNRPILTDDIVDNPFFSPEGPKQIALIGDFQNRSQLEQAISAVGSTVKENIHPDLDFAITGSNAEDTDRFDSARNLGILLLNVDNIQGFIE